MPCGFIAISAVLIQSGAGQKQGVPAYLSNTFFGNANRISVPEIPASISQPALLGGQRFASFQGTRPVVVGAPANPLLGARVVPRPFVAQPVPAVAASSPFNSRSLVGGSFVNLGVPQQQQPLK